jgi:hypothetical protein
MTRQTADDDPILAVLAPSMPRRWSGIAALIILGILLIWLAFSAKPTFVWQVFYLVCGIGILWGADKMRRVTADRIELTRKVLRTSSGHVLTEVSNVRRVERGAFAFKPSNGFLVRLNKPSGKGWAPGLWWQSGTFLGIGGVVPGGQSRAMAEILTALQMGVIPDVVPR